MTDQQTSVGADVTDASSSRGDDVFDLGEGASAPTLLDGLRSELAKEVRNDTIVLTVPGRPKMSLVFDPNLDSHTVQMWRKRCVDKKLPDQFDGLKFGCMVIANTCIGMKYNGTDVERSDGKPMTFRDEELLDMLGNHSTVVDAVRWLYGVDAHIFKTTEEIFDAAGFDGGEDDDLAVDPTVLS